VYRTINQGAFSFVGQPSDNEIRRFFLTLPSL